MSIIKLFWTNQYSKIVQIRLEWKKHRNLNYVISNQPAFGNISIFFGMGIFFHISLCILASIRDQLWNKLCRIKEENETNASLQKMQEQIKHVGGPIGTLSNDNLSTVTDVVHM